MPVSLSSGVGNIPDPYLGFDISIAPIENQMQASYEDTYFENTITGVPLPGYDVVISMTSVKGINDRPVTFADVFPGDSTENDFTYVEPSFDETTKDKVSAPSGTSSIIISGNVGTVFIDKYYKHRRLTDKEEISVDYPSGLAEIPNTETVLHLYKASFMRYNILYYTITLVHLNTTTGATTTETQVAAKRIINSWEADRLALINKINTIGI
jgi:hypothetical protein